MVQQRRRLIFYRHGLQKLASFPQPNHVIKVKVRSDYAHNVPIFRKKRKRKRKKRNYIVHTAVVSIIKSATVVTYANVFVERPATFTPRTAMAVTTRPMSATVSVGLFR